MNWLAIRMLVGDRRKYFVITFGVAFASMMMAHQMSVFWGVMQRTVNQIRDVNPDGIWVMNRDVLYADEIKPLPEMNLYRIRGIAGVAWAVPLHKSIVRAQTECGAYREVVLLGIDDNSLIGAPQKMVLGSCADLQRPDAVVVDRAGYTYLWPDEPFRLGRILEINERRAVLMGICEASPPFQTLPIVYTRFLQAKHYSVGERSHLTFILVGKDQDADDQALCERIGERTGLLALTAEEFSRRTIVYYFRFTGIPINFGIVVMLGFVVGIAVAGQNFYLFTIDNLTQFGTLKAIGVSDFRLVAMIVLQAIVVALLGFMIGMGLVALLIDATTSNIPHLAGFHLSWQVLTLTGIAILFIMVLSSLVSIRRVLVLEPAAIFRN